MMTFLLCLDHKSETFVGVILFVFGCHILSRDDWPCAEVRGLQSTFGMNQSGAFLDTLAMGGSS